MPAEIEATYRVVTPLFCAGAEQDRPELRLPSFKGVLRFWWRASAWSRCRGDLGRVETEEAALFGSADRGRSLVSMRLVLDRQPTALGVRHVLTTGGSVVGQGARYLGYGVMEAFDSRNKGTKAGELTRACLRTPFDFTVQARLRSTGPGDEEHGRQLASLEDAFVCVGTVGGLGAKSRKGYGSLVLQSLAVNGKLRWRNPQTRQELQSDLQRLRGVNRAHGLPPYTAFSDDTRCLLVSSGKRRLLELLDLVGRELVRYRSWGHNGTVLGQPSERNFKDDHDLMAGRCRRDHPRRIAFGLPHNYGRRLEHEVGPWNPELDRRASPLFIHLHECGNEPVAVVSFLPGRFLPDNRSDISVGGSRVRQTPEPTLYRPIEDFLDRLLDPRQCKEPLTSVEVKP